MKPGEINEMLRVSSRAYLTHQQEAERQRDEAVRALRGAVRYMSCWGELHLNEFNDAFGKAVKVLAEADAMGGEKCAAREQAMADGMKKLTTKLKDKDRRCGTCKREGEDCPVPNTVDRELAFHTIDFPCWQRKDAP